MILRRHSAAKHALMGLLASLIAAAAVAACVAQEAAAPGAVPAWTIAFKKGDVSLHRRTITLSGRSPDGKTDVLYRFKPSERVEIRDVNARGEATVVTTCISRQVLRDGR